MQLGLKKAYIQSNPLLAELIADFNQFSSISDAIPKQELLSKSIKQRIEPLIKRDQEPVLNSFDEKIGRVKMDMLEVPSGKYSFGRVDAYLQLLGFLYELRNKFIELNELKGETEYVLKEKQKRVVSPDLVAFEPMGNNKLDISYSNNSHSLIID